MHIEFTQADESHVEELVDLINSAYRGESSKKGWTTEANILDGQRTDPESLLQLINKDESVILVAEDEDAEELVGSVHLEKAGTFLKLGMLTVAPEYQNKKIGNMLLEEAAALAEFWDCTHIQIAVISIRTELIAWYLKKGFKKTSHTEAFPNNPRFGIPKVQNLTFEFFEKKI